MKFTYRTAAIALATVMALGLGVAPSLAATGEPIEGSATTRTWKVSAKARTTLTGNIAFVPYNLLYQAGNVDFLNIRIHDRFAQPLSASTTWVNAYDKRSVISGMNPQTFLVASCCSSANDTYWSGYINW